MTSKRGFLKGMLAAPAAAVMSKTLPAPDLSISEGPTVSDLSLDHLTEKVSAHALGVKEPWSAVKRVQSRIDNLKRALKSEDRFNDYHIKYHDRETTYVPDCHPISQMKSIPPWKKVEMYKKDLEQQRIRRMEAELMTMEKLLDMPEDFIDEIANRFL